jgi:hypothetical protein
MRKLTTESFIQKAKSVHGEKYNYSKVDYVGSLSKVSIVCPEHGGFLQSPFKHTQGRGCPKCGNEARSESKKSNTEEFIAKAKSVHGEKYDYSKTEYISSATKVIIKCFEHGEFLQNPVKHTQGQGCSKCGDVSMSEKQRFTQEEFIQKANEKHNNKYDYSKVQYVDSQTRVILTCSQHGDFLQVANTHLQGKGCPECAQENTGWTRTKFVNRCESKDGIGTLYVIECYNETERFIKFGITSNTINKRYSSKIRMPYSYRILAEYTGEPEFAYNLEVGLKRQMRLNRYTPQIHFGGHTECFIRTEEE